ncbi:hypothetical protein MSG28_005376 [Choristoneura fumiferana]|uniref:Uncharacterized protein n=1 Tax=Choristoneura fumiferana TaxID=7141 RepID=A0ACC0JR03_CHOFU|nr:hypothetical protein MSG28_005376 [Choristoneura fumiferana]
MLSEQRKLTTSIHGERLRRDKQLARKSFISGHHHILVATSAAVCGPDIKDVDIVVNYDLPTRVEEYVHRIVRTGRVGHRGKAVSFFDIDHDAGLVDDLTRVLRQANQPLPDFFPVESAATCQISDAMAVTSEWETCPSFRKTNRNADFIAVMLSEQRKLTTSIHGDACGATSSWREKLHKCHHHILVATSAAVCGPDIKDVDIVVNYDLPTSVEEYVHRIVRTGRVGHRGKAVSFFDIDHDAGLVDDLTRVLRQANQPLPDFFPVESAATCQISDAMAVTSEIFNNGHSSFLLPQAFNGGPGAVSGGLLPSEQRCARCSKFYISIVGMSRYELSSRFCGDMGAALLRYQRRFRLINGKT